MASYGYIDSGVMYVIRHNDGMTAAEHLAAWLRAQLDEDERVAQAATPGPWHAQDGGVVNDDDDQWPVSRTESERDRADRVHIARHDPARVLLDIAAKRKILDEYVKVSEDALYGVKARDPEVTGHAFGLLRAIAFLALPYAGRPGYRAEWRP